MAAAAISLNMRKNASLTLPSRSLNVWIARQHIKNGAADAARECLRKAVILLLLFLQALSEVSSVVTRWIACKDACSCSLSLMALIPLLANRLCSLARDAADHPHDLSWLLPATAQWPHRLSVGRASKVPISFLHMANRCWVLVKLFDESRQVREPGLARHNVVDPVSEHLKSDGQLGTCS